MQLDFEKGSLNILRPTALNPVLYLSLDQRDYSSHT